MDNKDVLYQKAEILKKKLYIIHCQNWILSKSNGKGAAGETLECLLGKENDNYALPDIDLFELKSRKKYSTYPLHLFCCTFDNKPLEMQRLLKIGGYPDKNNSTFNVFNTSIDAICYKNIRKYSYKIYVDYENEKVKLIITVRNSHYLVTEMSWSFFELKLRLESKLRYLVLVEYKKETLKNKEYFKYDLPIFYKMKNFEHFLRLIEIGAIKVTFKLSYYHSGERYGQFYDKGTSFDLDYNYINILYEKLDI